MASDRSPPSAQSGLVLTLDAGTSSVRCLAFDDRGDPHPALHAAREHEPRSTPDGGSELDASLLLRNSLACLRETSTHAAAMGHALLAVGVCTFWHAFLAVARDGTPLTPIYLWSDTRAAQAAATLRGQLDQRAVHRRTGCVLHPSYLPARLLWLRRQRPELAAPGVRFLSFGEFLEQALFGSPRISVSMASATGLFNQQTLDWDAEILAHLALTPGHLAPLCREHAPVCGMRRPHADDLPALRNVPFYPALGDGACSNLGSGATRPGLAALMIGTSAAVRLFFAEGGPPAPSGLWRYLLDGRQSLIGGAISNGGNLIAWLRRSLRLPAPARLEAELARAEPASHGLSMLPFLAGERNPDYPLEASGVLVGLKTATSPVQIVQAGMEAVAFRLAALARLLRQVDPELGGFVASGGLLGSPAWLRILADVLGLPLMVSTVQEASSRGAALMALQGLGRIKSASDLPAPVAERIEPDPARHSLYGEAMAEHERLYARFIQPGM